MIFTIMQQGAAVVPGYYLVCYNIDEKREASGQAVVPGYYLVCYNFTTYEPLQQWAVVPGYYLVCYNCYNKRRNTFVL